MFIKISESDLVRKVIKRGVVFHFKKIEIFQNEEEKNELFFTYHITLIFPTQKFKS